MMLRASGLVAARPPVRRVARDRRGRAGRPGRARTAAARPACSTRSPGSARRRARSRWTASIRARSGPAQRPAWLTYLPATRDIPWPLLARDLIALGGGGEVAGLELDGAARPARRHAVDRRAQPGADRPGAGAAAEAAAARRADRQSRSALADPADGAGPRGDAGGGRAALVAIHDLDAAARYADRILVMDGGRIAAEGLDGPHVARDFRGRARSAASGGGQAAGGSAIIAVKSAWAASLSPT